MTVDELIEHYKETELSLERYSEDQPEFEKAWSTKRSYACYIATWIAPRWGKYGLTEVRTIEVEHWLRQLTLRDGRKMARGSKAKIRNTMQALFNHAIRWEWLPQNADPISKVRQSAKRERIPDILDIAEIRALLAELKLRERVLVLLAVTTGLRRGELFGLKWKDVDFDQLQISVTRSIVQQVVGRCKTEASQRPVPLDPAVAEMLKEWKQAARYNEPNHWLFASCMKDGRLPIWPDRLLYQVLLPAARKAGIAKRLGYHSFRRTTASLLKANGVDVKIVQELMRHANSNITMNIYAQALTPAKREAQNKLAAMILPREKDDAA